MTYSRKPIKGRGAGDNPENRFIGLYVENEAEFQSCPKSTFLTDYSKTVLTKNDSPDIGFDYSLNPYRGCEHGCIYCYARPTHEYLGYSAGFDFESKILVKKDAPQLLRKQLSHPKWIPQPIILSGVTDPYQPVERKLEITRQCLQVLAEFRNPVSIITKNYLVTRDIDILADMAKDQTVKVHLSVTSLQPDLLRVMEPRTSSSVRRLEAIRKLTDAGIPTGVMVAPVIPALTDHEIPAILQAASEAGALSAGYVMLRLPFAVKPLFEEWLESHFPDRKAKIINRIKDLRGGKLYDSNFGSRMRGEGQFADQVNQIFKLTCKKNGMNKSQPPLSTSSFRNPESRQLSLFS
ncbi:MAG: PA0069 family radical SAM protein [Balneolales bacterium]